MGPIYLNSRSGHVLDGFDSGRSLTRMLTFAIGIDGFPVNGIGGRAAVPLGCSLLMIPDQQDY